MGEFIKKFNHLDSKSLSGFANNILKKQIEARFGKDPRVIVSNNGTTVDAAEGIIDW